VNALFDTYALAKMMPVEAGVRVPPVIDTVIDTPREHVVADKFDFQCRTVNGGIHSNRSAWDRSQDSITGGERLIMTAFSIAVLGLF